MKSIREKIKKVFHVNGQSDVLVELFEDLYKQVEQKQEAPKNGNTTYRFHNKDICGKMGRIANAAPKCECEV